MRILVIFFLVACNLPVCGQYTIAGKIVDGATGESLIGANIYLLSDLQVGTTSDVNGDFKLTVPEKYSGDSLLISYVGYREIVSAVKETGREIRMEPKEQQMMEVTVSATPLIAEEFKLTKINKLEIYTSPAAKADPLLAVNAMPSSTTADESASISLRGSSSIETGIFLNNVPVYDAVRYGQLNGIGTFSLFNTALVQDLTVFPGNPPLEFGNTTSGVVAITTDEAAVQQSNHSLIMSPANIGYQRNQKMGRFSLMAFSNFQPSAALKFINPNALEQIRKFQSLDLGFYIYGKVGKQTRVKSYNYGLTESYIYDFIHPTFQGDFNQRKKRALNVTNLSHETDLGRFQWNQGYAFSTADYGYSASAFSVLNRSLFQGVNFYRRTEKLHFKIGASYDFRSSAVEGTFFEYPYALGADHPTFFLTEEVSTGILEVYAYSKYYLTDNWVLGGGLRKNLNELAKQNYLSKQVNLTYLFSESWKVIVGAGEYHKHGILENQGELVAISSKQASIDLFYDRGIFKSSVSFFTKANDWKRQGSKNVSGIEAFIEARIGNDWLGNVSYTFLKTQADQGLDEYDMGYFFRGNLKYTPGAFWTLSFNSIYRQGLQYYPVSSTEMDPSLGVFQPFYTESASRYSDYFILNLAVSRLFSVSEEMMLVTFASVNNVTDRQNVRSYRYDFDYSEKTGEFFSRRVIYFGLQITF